MVERNFLTNYWDTVQNVSFKTEKKENIKNI